MNTNSKKIVRVILLPLLFLSFCFANSVNQISSKIKANGIYERAIKFSKDEYVVGSYSFSSSVDSLNLLDEKKRLIRRLDKHNKKNGNFYFLAEATQNYFFEVKNLNESNNVEIKIEKVVTTKGDSSAGNEDFLSKKIEEVYKELENQGDTSKFWNYVEKVGTPLVEEYDKESYVLTFLYKDAKRDVKILGAPVSEHVKLKRLLESDIWYKSFIVPKGTRLSYQLAPDTPIFEGTKWEKRVSILATSQKDSYNKYPLIYGDYKDKYNIYSSIVLPNGKFKDWSLEKSKENFYKKEITFKSEYLKNSRDITILSPKELKKEKEYPLLFIFDSLDYQSKIDTQTILNNLISKDVIPEVIVVFIANPTPKARATELPCNEDFASFMAKELYPYIKEEFKKEFKASNNILIGSSYGGLASSYIAFKYPNIFGKVLSMSGSYWWKPEDKKEYRWLSKEFIKSEKVPVEFFLSAGIFEGGDSEIEILNSNRYFRDILETKGYKVFFEEVAGGHDYFSWRVILPYGLKILLNK
ncbi:alpha/beta hydrolase-fold protein [Halarcobacter ebronensis]|uniref:alpha/beta hydrolase-fold protein n=1 Tax=Halarcobacter ebronensis TaxID=1462615 RepID=UPI0013E999BA|nr:alpha/beta hydrolase-fold protein [Halarcobacter ebronensis]